MAQLDKKPTKISFKQLFEFASCLPRIPSYEQHKTFEFAVVNEQECTWKTVVNEMESVNISTVRVKFNPKINDWELVF